MNKSRNWVIGFLFVLFLGIAAYMGLNYYANPLGYFTTNKGLDHIFVDDYGRSIKTRYLMAHNDEIEGVILGGSKSGAIDPAMMTELTGLNYYNFYITQGNWADYERFIRFFIDHTNIKEVTLALSSYETLNYDRTKTGNNYKVPAAIKDNAWSSFTEFLSYLMTDPGTVRKALTGRSPEKLAKAEDLTIGMRVNTNYENAFLNDPASAISKYVNNRYDERLATLFSGTAEDEYYGAREDCVASMKRIKEMCDESGLRLNVVIGSSDLAERYTYECSGYYDYMRRMVNIFGEVWDFSDFNAVNMNPYNFINEKHYSRTIANLMFSTIYGRAAAGFENAQGIDRVDGFGILLTPDNVNEYLTQRKADYDALKAEYEATGTVVLPGIEDASYVDRSNEYK